jgi:hypothetical protein
MSETSKTDPVSLALSVHSSFRGADGHLECEDVMPLRNPVEDFC